jgi:hypothetical protein
MRCERWAAFFKEEGINLDVVSAKVLPVAG